jgi:G3E family GTPase
MTPPSHAPSRVPVCLVTGLTGADKRAFIGALLAARPAEQHWALLDNDNSDIAGNAASAKLVVSVINGCACCTGQVALQTGIVQLIRQSRPQRLIIAAAGVAEPAALAHALQQEHLARGINVDHRFCVLPSRPLDQLPQAARDLLQQQMAAADHVVCKNPVAAQARAGAAPETLQFSEAVCLVLASPTPASSASSRRIAS